MEGKVANVTIALDAALLRRARIKALEEGTSLNAVLRERVEEYVSRASPAKAAQQTFLRLAEASKARGGGRSPARTCMSEGDGPYFLDSNILIYAFDTGEPRKRAQSRALIESLPAEAIVLSAQVVNEFYFAVTRKLSRKVPAADAEAAVRGLSGFRILPLDYRLSMAAMELVRKHQLSIWDALILESALEGRCSTLFSEDFQHGRTYGTLKVSNPFVD